MDIEEPKLTIGGYTVPYVEGSLYFVTNNKHRGLKECRDNFGGIIYRGLKDFRDGTGEITFCVTKKNFEQYTRTCPTHKHVKKLFWKKLIPCRYSPTINFKNLSKVVMFAPSQPFILWDSQPQFVSEYEGSYDANDIRVTFYGDLVFMAVSSKALDHLVYVDENIHS